MSALNDTQRTLSRTKEITEEKTEKTSPRIDERRKKSLSSSVAVSGLGNGAVPIRRNFLRWKFVFIQ
jgi:hypothetical protein